MSSTLCTSASVQTVEALMHEKFMSEPFHNLHLIYGKRLRSPKQGGTCSDKTLSFLTTAQQAGVDALLHSGFIDGREIHRLAAVHIGGRRYFADVGNGWPALKLYPADREIHYRCFGMGFRTEIKSSRVSVFHERNGKEILQLEIDLYSRPEHDIMADIASRFSSGIEYPFSTSLRFSMIVGNRFLFLRGNRLEIYSDSGFEMIEGIEGAKVPSMIHQYFGYDVEHEIFRTPD